MQTTNHAKKKKKKKTVLPMQAVRFLASKRKKFSRVVNSGFKFLPALYVF